MYTLALATILASFHSLLTAPRSPFAGRSAIAVPNNLAPRQRFLQHRDAGGGCDTDFGCPILSWLDGLRPRSLAREHADRGHGRVRRSTGSSHEDAGARLFREL